MEDQQLTALEKFYADDAYCGFTGSFDVARYAPYAGFVKKWIQGGQVHEIGSGLGQAAYALKCSNVNVVATDIFPNNAQNAYKRESIDIPVEYLNVNKIDRPDGSVANYCMYQVMEHIESPRTALLELHRTLRPGGRLVIVGPNLISPLTAAKCLVYGFIGKWEVPWFKRTDGYSYPFGDTMPGVLATLARNSVMTLAKLAFKGRRQAVFREPCLKKPAISDSDAVFYLNPIDLREMMESVGLKVVSYQEGKRTGSFAGSTWIVGER